MKTRAALEAEKREAAWRTLLWGWGLERARARGFRGLEAVIRGKPRVTAFKLPPAGR